jgi:hypothetical protein
LPLARVIVKLDLPTTNSHNDSPAVASSERRKLLCAQAAEQLQFARMCDEILWPLRELPPNHAGHRFKSRQIFVHAISFCSNSEPFDLHLTR